MAYDNAGGFKPRQMFNVAHMNLKCATCGAEITELPFEPSTDRDVYCRDCNRARKGNSFKGGRGRF